MADDVQIAQVPPPPPGFGDTPLPAAAPPSGFSGAPTREPSPPKLGADNTGFVDERLPPGSERVEIPKEEVLPRAFSNAYNQFVGEVTGAKKQVTEDPLKAAGKAVEGTGDIIRSTLALAGLPITLPTWAIASGLQDIFGGKEATKFGEKWIKPPADMMQGFQDKYGHWLGGPGNYGWTPELGWANLKNTVANRPWEVGADVVPSVGGAFGKFLIKPGRTIVGTLAEAETKLKGLGIDTANMTQQQIEKLRVRMNEVGWDQPVGTTPDGKKTTALTDRKAAIEEERRRILFGDAGVDPTESMLTGSEKARHREDRIRNGQEGTSGAEIMNDADARRIDQTNARTDQVRSQITGAPDRMEPAAIGKTVTDRYQFHDDAAKKVVTDKYNDAFDQTKLAQNGVASHVPEADVKGLSTAVRDSFTNSSKPFVVTEAAAPNTTLALGAIDDFSKTGRIPTIPGQPMPPVGTSGVSWQSAEGMRSYLVGLRESARATPIDYAAMSRVIDAFDKQFGKSNPLLNDARQSHADRMAKFHPDEYRAGDDVVKAAEALSNPHNNGLTQFNALFEGKFNSGQQIDAINHLKSVFANDPAALQALKEGALEKVFVNKKNYDALSPQKTATALDAALNGPQGAIYKTLFTPEELTLLRQHQELTSIVGKHTRPINPPRSGHENVINERKLAAQERAKQFIEGLITAAGSGAGYLTGDATTGVVGAGGGYGAGRAASAVVGPKLGDLYQKIIADPAGARAAGRMSMPPPANAPQMSYPVAGALSASGAAATPEPEKKARGGALRLAGSR